MIGAVSEPLQKRQYLQAAWNCPGLAARLACQLELFGQKPGGGWRFFTADRGTLAALALRGGAAFGCGDFCGEELGLLLRFSGVREYLCPAGSPAPAGYRLGEEYPLYTAPTVWKGPAPALPGEVALDWEPFPTPVSRLVWEEEGDQACRENFYSDLCTARSRGMALVAGAWAQGELKATVGAYALWQGLAYLAAAQTTPAWRGRGIGGALIRLLALRLAEEGYQPWFWCRPGLCAHYEALGFIQKGKLSKFIQIES